MACLQLGKTGQKHVPILVYMLDQIVGKSPDNTNVYPRRASNMDVLVRHGEWLAGPDRTGEFQRPSLVLVHLYPYHPVLRPPPLLRGGSDNLKRHPLPLWYPPPS